MKRTHQVLATVVVLLVAVGVCCGQREVDSVRSGLPASILTLMAQPASNSPELVQVSGFLALDFEGQALYLHKEDYEEGLTRNAIRLALTPAQVTQFKELAGTYVVVEASFLKRRKSEDIFTGSLFNVRQIRKTLSRH